MRSRRTRVRSLTAGALLLLAGVQYAVLEYIAASAWHHPSYSYAVGFISDLGNPVAGDVYDGRVINSPRHLVMDAAFIAQGVLFIVAGVLLLREVDGRLGRVLRGLVIAHGVGVILIGFFHESARALHNGVIIVHGVGAAAAIVCGNVIALVIGAKGERLGVPRWLRSACSALGMLGLAAFVLLQVDRPLYHAAGGVPERVSVYTILLFEALVGVTLLVRPPRLAPISPVHNSLERHTS
ncbi:putative membrane protein [Catenulispora sp. GP43]|uniref:DUF998 domain-containing protein n=1 Tax=Catenulispora sp. GP43 TaxID=3156263 RepID=UPI003511D387